MEISELKENLKSVVYLRDEISELKKNNVRSYSLYEYADHFRNKLIFTNHGDRDKFWWPSHVASNRLDEIFDINERDFNSKFSANKTKILSIMNSYIKEIQQGLKEYESE